MDIGKVFVDSVIVGQRHRALDADKVEALAESIDALGLQQPISVHIDGDDAVHLITGLHRLEAAKKLGWEQVEASFVKMSPTRREMWEIAENLFRVDLSKEQRDEHIRRYAELMAKDEEAKKAEAAERQVTQTAAPVLSDGRRRGPQHEKGIARKVAEATGVSVDTARRALYQPDPIRNLETRVRHEHDRAIRDDLSDAAADLLFEKFGTQDVPYLISLFEGASLKEIIAGLRRRLHDTPVFDRGAA